MAPWDVSDIWYYIPPKPPMRLEIRVHREGNHLGHRCKPVFGVPFGSFRWLIPLLTTHLGKMSSFVSRQDMPPPGGFPALHHKGVNLPRKGFSALTIFGAFFVVSTFALVKTINYIKEKNTMKVNRAVERAARAVVLEDMYGPAPLQLKHHRAHLAAGVKDTRVRDFLEAVDLNEKIKWVESQRPLIPKNA